MATAEQTFDQLRAIGLAEADADIAGLIDRELGRQRDQLELIASENFTWPAVLEAVGSVLDQQVRRGLPGAALLRRVRVGRRGRAARDRPGQGAVRRRPRQRPAARRRAGEPGGVLRAARARRPDPGAAARPRRPPDARPQGQLLGPALRRPCLRRPPRGLADRLRRGGAAGEGVPAAADRRRGVGLSPRHRGRPVPRDRRRGGRDADGRHGPLRRAGRGRHPSRTRSSTPTSSRRRRTRRLPGRGRGSC